MYASSNSFNADIPKVRSSSSAISIIWSLSEMHIPISGPLIRNSECGTQKSMLS